MHNNVWRRSWIMEASGRPDREMAPGGVLVRLVDYCGESKAVSACAWMRECCVME